MFKNPPSRSLKKAPLEDEFNGWELLGEFNGARLYSSDPSLTIKSVFNNTVTLSSGQIIDTASGQNLPSGIKLLRAHDVEPEALTLEEGIVSVVRDGVDAQGLNFRRWIDSIRGRGTKLMDVNGVQLYSNSSRLYVLAHSNGVVTLSNGSSVDLRNGSDQSLPKGITIEGEWTGDSKIHIELVLIGSGHVRGLIARLFGSN